MAYAVEENNIGWWMIQENKVCTQKAAFLP